MSPSIWSRSKPPRSSTEQTSLAPVLTAPDFRGGGDEAAYPGDARRRSGATLAPLARTATRLHPRPGPATPHDSSVGGPLLRPADEPWPHCDEGHGGPGPVAMLPVAQLYVRDIPPLRTPGRADLLQVLWCPFDHEPDDKPLTALFWRTAADVTDVLVAPPEPFDVEDEGSAQAVPVRAGADHRIPQPHGAEQGGAATAGGREQVTGGWIRMEIPYRELDPLRRPSPRHLVPRRFRTVEPDPARPRPRLRPATARLPGLPGTSPHRPDPVGNRIAPPPWRACGGRSPTPAGAGRWPSLNRSPSWVFVRRETSCGTAVRRGGRRVRPRPREVTARNRFRSEGSVH